MAAGADEMVERAFDPKQQDVVAKAIEQLSPEEAQFFLEKLERAIRKRKLQLVGYLAAMVVWLAGMVIALMVYGAAADDTFIAWVFILPFAAVGLVLMSVGRVANRVGTPPLPPAAVRDKTAKAGKPAAAK